MNRRLFLKSLAAGGIAASASGVAGGTAKTKTTIKFSAFADIHHLPHAFMTHAPERLSKIQARAVRERVDLIVDLGDFCHNPRKETAFCRQFATCPIPSYHVLGNHDCDGNTFAETLAAYGMKSGHYFFDVVGFRFIALDTSYLSADEGHFENSNQYKRPGGERGFVARKEISWFRETLTASPYPCIVLSHQSLERERDGVGNLPELRRIINEVNIAVPHKVPLCINGHFHRNFLRILDGVAYLDLNSASQDWIGPAEVTCYPKELYKQYQLLDKNIVWNDPIHAIITLDTDGWLTIDGMKSTYFMGITPEKAIGSPNYDSSGRPTSCEVLSAHLKLW